MDKFIKLFEYEEYGQVAVIRDEYDDEPGVRILFKPPGMGVNKITVTFHDAGSADQSFNFVTKDGMRDVIEEQFEMARKMAKEEG